jgi:hypothetical protein
VKPHSFRSHVTNHKEKQTNGGRRRKLMAEKGSEKTLIIFFCSVRQ